MKLKGFMAALLAAIFYGTNPLGTLQLYADGMNPSSVLVYRYAFATLMFLLWMAVKRESLTIKWGVAIRLAILGTLMSMSSATLYLSFRFMDAGVASTILFSYPIMVAVLMVVFYHERLTWRTSLCILMAISGIALLYHGKGGVTLSTVGVTLVILSSLLYAFYIIGVNQTHTQLSPVKFTFWIVFFGLIALLVYTLFIGERLEPLRTSGPVTVPPQRSSVPPRTLVGPRQKTPCSIFSVPAPFFVKPPSLATTVRFVA